MAKKQKPRSVLDLPLVEVVWIDAALAVEAGGSLNEPQPAETTGLLECRDVGYLVELTRREIKMAVSVSPEDNSYRHMNSIPRGWVKAVIYLRRSESEAPSKNAAPTAAAKS